MTVITYDSSNGNSVFKCSEKFISYSDYRYDVINFEYRLNYYDLQFGLLNEDVIWIKG